VHTVPLHNQSERPENQGCSEGLLESADSDVREKERERERDRSAKGENGN
jgi:hypothetical protein